MLGIGAAWNAEESAGLGFAFPPTAERFERLEETLQIILQMWSDSEGPYEGKHYRLGRTLNSPQSLSSPRPRILIGGSGERKTLRLVAQYADACNLFGGGELAHKLDVLREHCANLGRDYDSIEKTAIIPFELGRNGEGADRMLDRLREMHDLGITVATGSLRGPDGPDNVAAYGEHIIPEISTW
jgi:alkanesulfonate monooxygenase SsuD/methylene tetrahydromethanopterin reductase-like flavin-dependent oxidoreductase (luciferase family)